MKSMRHLFFISLICISSAIFYGCLDHPHDEQAQEPGHRQMSTLLCSVQGVICESCALTIKSSLLAAQGIENVEAYPGGEEDNVRVIFNRDKITAKEIKKMLSDLGMRVSKSRESPQK